MPVDPAIVMTDPAAKQAAAVADLDRRVRQLERGQRGTQVITGSPSTTSVEAGTPVVDDGAPSGSIRLGLYVPSRGGWKYTTLS